MRIALMLFSLAFATPAFAQEKLTVAYCKNGGCRCALSNVTLDRAALVLGQPAPAGTKYLVHINGEYSWTAYSLREIDLIAGGDGDCPLELFEAMVPEDGNWLGRVTGRSISQCPAGLESAVDTLIDAMVFPRDIKWGGSFHPDKMRIEGSAAAIKWTRISETHFRGEGPSAKSSGASSTVDIGVTYDAKLINPRLTQIEFKLKVRGKGASQQMIDAMGMGKCDVTVKVDVKRS